MAREEITVAEFRDRMMAQGVSSQNHTALICPACQTVQSITDHIKAGATPDEAERAIGFACVGRRTNAGPPRKKPDGKPCNWSLGGLFQIHELTVVTEDGKKHPRFAFATPEQAQAHEAANTPSAESASAASPALTTGENDD
jgi:hypothetical protein